MSKNRYNRIILKVSGEMLRSKSQSGIAIGKEELKKMCGKIKEAHDLGVQAGIIIGGGNIFRGLSTEQGSGDIERVSGDYMGMLATVINGIAIRDTLIKMGVPTRVQSALPIGTAVEQFSLDKAVDHLNNNRVVVFVGGTGNPYFSTDTAAAVRASELKADIIFKATKVDGVYDKDPVKYKDAVKIDEISFIGALNKRIRVMDLTAFSLCMNSNVPILVFDLDEKDSISKAVLGKKIGSLIHKEN